jgi:hypothetical protein
MGEAVPPAEVSMAGGSTEAAGVVLEPQMSDFDAIWQTYINYAPSFEAENWEALLGDADIDSNGF